MSRVPQINGASKDRQARISQLERRLAGLGRLPVHRRADEHADEIERDIEALLRELQAEAKEGKSDV